MSLPYPRPYAKEEYDVSFLFHGPVGFHTVARLIEFINTHATCAQCGARLERTPKSISGRMYCPQCLINVSFQRVAETVAEKWLDRISKHNPLRILVRPDKYTYIVEENSFDRASGGFVQTNRHITSTKEKAIGWAQAHLDILEDAIVAGVPASFSILEWETDNEEWDGEHICVGWIRSNGTFLQPEHGAHREVANGLR